MDNLPPSQPLDEPQVYIIPTPWYKRKIVWIFLLILILIPLGSYGYKHYFIKTSTTSQPIPSSSPTTSANPLIAQAKSIGYDIIFIHPKDITGRTVFYQDRSKAEVNFRGNGIVDTKAASESTQKIISYIAGTFISFKEIDNSPDLYVDSIDPQTGAVLPRVRLILTKDSSTKTFFRVENLLYGPNHPFAGVNNTTEGDLGILSHWTKEDLNKIIKTGDAVVINLVAKDQSGNLINQTDGSKELIGTLFVIRRFNGQKQIEKELGRNL